MRNRVASLRQPLRRQAFRHLWLGLMLSRIGDAFTVIALSWFVLELAGPAEVGLVLMFFGLPALVSGPLMGRLLDRRGVRLVMGLDNLGRSLLIAFIPVLYWLGVFEIWHTYVVAFLSGLLRPASEVGESVVTPRLVRDDELEEANALTSANWEISDLVGPVLAGVLVEVVGAPTTLMIDAMSFLVMSAVAFSLPGLQRDDIREEKISFRETLFGGFISFIRMRAVGLIAAVSVVFLLVHGVQQVLLPVYSSEILAAGASGYGILASAIGVGSLLGLLLTGPLTRNVRPGISFGFIFVVGGLLFLPLAVVEGLPLALVFIFLTGAASAPFYVVRRTLMQRLVPEHLRGQVFGAQASISAAGFPAGSALGGFLLAGFSVPLVIVLVTGASVVLGVATFFSRTLHAATRKAPATTP